MKTVFVINGLDIHQTAADSKYKELRGAIDREGYNVIPSSISWRYITPTQYTDQFVKFYRKNKSTDGNIVIGNSFGAVVALLSTQYIEPDLVILCSLSPFFKEDQGDEWPPKRYLRILGKQRLEDIGEYSATELAHEINKKDIRFKILYGEKEHETSPKLVKRTRKTASQIKNSELIEVSSAPHNFIEPDYITGIINALR